MSPSPSHSLYPPAPPEPQTPGQGSQTSTPHGPSDTAEASYPIPTPSRADLAPPARTVDPSAHSGKDELRRLAEEDTRRRMAQSGVEDARAEGVRGVAVGAGAGGLKPRRRG